MVRWIVIAVLALSALFLAMPAQADAAVMDYLGANHRQDGYLDFNNDGKTDIFRTTGQYWQVSYGGTSSWQILRASSYQLENGLCFGNFVGDARTDVFLTWNGKWYVSDGGTSGFTQINGSGYNQSDLAFGDFNGDGRTDVFVANGADWYVSYGGTSAWTKINGSDYKTRDLAFGDFNGDGKTDVFRASGTAWYVSYGGTSAWTKINTSSLKLGYLIYGMYYLGDMGLGDFDGDGKTDVFKADGTHWYVSYGGTSTWSPLKTWIFEADGLYFADFDGNRRTDVFKKVYAPPGWMVWFNEPSVYGGSSFREEIIYPSGPPPDMTAPVISELTVQSLTSTSAIITWTTNEPATSQVLYGKTTNYNESTPLESTLNVGHRHPLTILGFTELIPGTTYYYRALSRDAAGNLRTSDGSFTTPAAPTTTTTSSTTTTTTLPGTPTTTTTTTTPQPGTTTTTVPPGSTTTTTQPADDPLFTDVPKSHPYFDAIQYMGRAGMLSGYPQPDGTALFRPENNVLRAQFAKLVCGAFGIPVSESLAARFTDLGPDDPANLYPHDYVEAAAMQGIIRGKTPTTFDPWAAVTRAQMVTMVVRAAEGRARPSGPLATPPADYQGTFGDFSPNHQENMRIAEYNGLLAGIVGFGPSWDPWAPASRGEVARVLVNWIQPWAPWGG